LGSGIPEGNVKSHTTILFVGNDEAPIALLRALDPDLGVARLGPAEFVDTSTDASAVVVSSGSADSPNVVAATLDALRVLRESSPLRPIVWIARRPQRDLRSSVLRLRGLFADGRNPKSCAWAMRMLWRIVRLGPEAALLLVERFAAEHRLTARERNLVELSAFGFSQSDLGTITDLSARALRHRTERIRSRVGTARYRNVMLEFALFTMREAELSRLGGS
jgi:hypothetical protein